MTQPSSLSTHLLGIPHPHLDDRDSFMSQTLATAETLAIWQDFYRPSPSPSSDLEGNDFDEAHALTMLGSGMDGHPHTADDGTVATLLGEAMGTVGVSNKHRTKN